MNRKNYTIYFDTKFYVQLCHANVAEADQTIRSLNALNVRHVISNVLLRELLTSKDRSDLDEALVQRVRQFTLAPYCTEDDLGWEVLLLSGQDRINTAELLRALHDGMAVATSYSIMARRKMNAEQQAELVNASKPTLQELGFPDDLQQDIPQVVSATKGILKNLEELGLCPSIKWPENATANDLVGLSEQIKGILELPLLHMLEEQNRIQDSSTQTEDRPYKVAIGAASPKSAKGLSNTLRDTEHIMLFVQHQDEIDLLQVDKPHQAIINRAKPKHRLADLGLAHRCFSADSLLDTVAKVRELMPLQSE